MHLNKFYYGACEQVQPFLLSQVNEPNNQKCSIHMQTLILLYCNLASRQNDYKVCNGNILINPGMMLEILHDILIEDRISTLE